MSEMSKKEKEELESGQKEKDEKEEEEDKETTIKVGMLGDSAIGKTSLMIKYVQNKFQDNYLPTLGVNSMKKEIKMKKSKITFNLTDIGGDKEYIKMLPMVCDGADVILFMFDLSKKSTLANIKQWYQQARVLNKKALPFLIGTKYDLFATQSNDQKLATITLARNFAKAMKAALIFTSSSHSINVIKTFKVIIAKLYNISCGVERITQDSEPILEY